MAIFLDHFNQFYEPDENILLPLFFVKTCFTRSWCHTAGNCIQKVCVLGTLDKIVKTYDWRIWEPKTNKFTFWGLIQFDRWLKMIVYSGKYLASIIWGTTDHMTDLLWMPAQSKHRWPLCIYLYGVCSLILSQVYETYSLITVLNVIMERFTKHDTTCWFAIPW